MMNTLELASLPSHSLNNLCDETIDLARRLDAMIRHLVKEQGFAELRIVIKRGIPKELHVDRSFKLD